MKRKLANNFGTFVLFLSSVILFATIWTLNTFGIVTMEEIVFTMLVPQEGMNISIIYNFILEVLLPSLVSTAILYILLIRENEIGMEVDLKIKKFQFKKMVYPFHGGLKFLAVFLVLVISLIFCFYRLEILDYIKDQITVSTLIEEEYVDPRDVNISFENGKRNLIYIYLESMESSYTSYSNGGTQNVDLIPELTKLANDNISFSHTDKLGGAQAVPGTTWTVAAMVAQTSGLPLKLSIDGNAYGKYVSFLPGVYTLGDILREHGYNQKLMVGSEASFGGRENYFVSHGGYEIYDVNTAIKDGKMTEEDRVWWGFEDKNLYDWAKDEILELASQEEPFNFTLLTVDTHFEDGYMSYGCETKYDDQYSNVIACGSKMVYEFVEWIKEQDFYKNTAIVLVGDHLTMDADFFATLSPTYTRTIYNVFINSSVTTENTKNRVFTTLDMFPSTLASIGANVSSDRLGIGTNLFSDKQTLAEKYGIDVFHSELAMKSEFYNDTLVYPKDK
ncbi:MAG: LTA synthase family protein [Bacilli bacterium]|nr:LTA synthase family protein [Bacilli bacterium]